MKKLLLILTAVVALAGAADAKWWIFGKSSEEVGLKYLYVNKVSSEEAGPKIKIFKETLGSDGLVKINGKAAVGKGGVGSVRISLDDKATWQEVKFADNGTFEYSFRPEQGKTYAMLLEITDTAGKTNKVEDTRKEITLSDENIQVKVRETLDAMFAAYNAENLQKFMGYVGEDFAGDKAILERAVKRDFDALSSINLSYTVNNVSAGAQGRVFVSVTYNRMVVVNKSGATSQDTGATEFVFDSNEGKLSLFSMKQPLMFGLSDADNVATGTVLGNPGSPLVINDSGNLGGKTASIRSTGPTQSFSFLDSTVYDEAALTPVNGDFAINFHFELKAGVGFQDLGVTSLSAVTNPPTSGYVAFGFGITPTTGHCYAFSLPGGRYGVIELITITGTAHPFTYTFRYRLF